MNVLYLDNHLLAISKPPGLLSQEDHTGDADVLRQGKAFLKKKFGKPGDVYLGLVHRLDRPGSGVMVLARTSKAARRLSEQFRSRLVEKRYLAIVEGEAPAYEQCVDYIKKEQQPGGGFAVRMAPADDPAAKRAELTVQRLAIADGLSLVQVQLQTGRPHQIRVQMAARGCPLLGDLRYGAHREMDGQNLALHSFLLRFEHPTRREPVQLTAPPPAAWDRRFAEVIEHVLRHAQPASAAPEPQGRGEE